MLINKQYSERNIEGKTPNFNMMIREGLGGGNI